MTGAGLSIVVPVAPGEGAWRALLDQLEGVEAEVLLAGPTPPPGLPPWVRWVEAGLGRALQLNAGAAAASGGWLLFLHADTVLPAGWREAVEQARREAPGALSFFRLRFAADGPRGTWLNAALANVRASWLGMPFGDQGFLLARATFERLGRFDPHVGPGEDHLLAWRALQRGAGQHTLPLPVVSSARKYARHGWVRVSWWHVTGTLRQALPELAELARQRLAPPSVPPPAVACFVKTPGRSPIKTRLAADVGPEAAARWYEGALRVQQALLDEVAGRGWEAWWAVADAPDDPRWATHPRLAQGDGDLGPRQHRVYAHLLARGRAPVLIGADTPHLGLPRLQEAVKRLRWCPFVAGEASDGGYDLFAGRLPIPAAVWASVPYSRADTLDRLELALRPHGRLERLPPLTDVDDAASLRRAMAEPAQVGEGQAAALRALWSWSARAVTGGDDLPSPGGAENSTRRPGAEASPEETR